MASSHMLAMFPNSPPQIVRHPDIQISTLTAEYVHEKLILSLCHAHPDSIIGCSVICTGAITQPNART
jgi:hypothetical protein